jgi:FKBP-type peptidyl-prolyl cis-trans isomerase
MTLNRILVACLMALLLSGCAPKEPTPSGTTAQETPATSPPASDSDKNEQAATEATKVQPGTPGGLTELKIEDIKVGQGSEVAEKGDLLLMAYTGKLKDGKEFDSNEKPGKDPFGLRLGAGTVIKGWDLGLVGMKKGGKRRLSIPSALAYGNQAMGDIPANSDLFFDVTLLDIVKASEPNVYDKWVLSEGKGPEAKSGDRITIAYTEKLVNGKQVYQTPKDQPTKFVLGQGGVVAGIDAALKGAKEGAVYKLRIPPDLAHGAQGTDKVPPNQVCIFEVRVLKVEPAGTFK